MRIKLIILTFLFLFFRVRFVFANGVVLNEIMPHPSPGSDWIEIYNPTSSNVDLSNWKLVDNTSTVKTLSGNITSNEFITFDITNRLNNSGDSIYLKDASGTTIDNYSYNSDPGINISFGRSPNGGDWTILASSSKGSTNGEPSYTPTPSPSPTPTPTPTPVPSASSSSSKTKTSTTAIAKNPTPTLNPITTSPSTQDVIIPTPSKPSDKITYQIASVAAVTTSTSSSAKVEIKSQKQTNFLVWAGVIFIFAGICTIGYIYFKKNADTNIKLRRRY